jgi:transcription termination factor Rho
MREKYESLSLVVLKDLAKARGLKGISTMKKGELVELMLSEDERDKEKAQVEAEAKAAEPKSAPVKKNVFTARATTEGGTLRRSSGRPPRRDGAERTSYTPRDERSSYASQKEDRAVFVQREERPSYSQREERNEETVRAEQASAASYTAQADEDTAAVKEDIASLDSGYTASGILEVMSDGFGFIRCENYLPGENDVYVAPSQIRRFNLKTGDIVTGNTKIKSEREKFAALLYVTSVNGYHPSEAQRRKNFEDLTPIFPDKRLHMERQGGSVAMRVMDIVSPIGKGQRGMIVSPPKAGKTTLLKQVAKSVQTNNPEMHLIILLIDERPEEVTDIREAIAGENVEVIYSTFDETAEHHKRVSEMVIERAKRLVEHGKDVMILLDSITRLARAYNLTCTPSGRTLSGGLDPAALHMPKRFFGAARNMREGGSLTILATALVETGSKMDDVVFEEFKGTGNMELVLDRKLSEKRIFPAVDIVKSGTRRDDLLLDPDEQIGVENMRRALNGMRSDEAVENILNMFAHTKSNAEFINIVKKNRIL